MTAAALTWSGLNGTTLRQSLRDIFGSRVRRQLPLGSTTSAAVLLPLFERDGEVHLWMVRRPASMRSHAGQVAFPGGKADIADGSLMETALRETEEELGIARTGIEVLGALDDIPTLTGFTVTPWAGWLAGDPEVRPNPSEVARAFAAPLRVFLEPPTGAPPRHGWRVDGEHVWGITAAIVSDFVRLIRE